MGVLCDGCAARTVLQLCWAGRGSRLLIFAGFELGVIFRRKNLLTLQLFAGVNVPGFFLLVLPAGAFLPCDFRNALLLVLRVGLLLILVLLCLLLGVALHGGRQCDRKGQQNEIGRASCRERGEITMRAGALERKKDERT